MADDDTLVDPPTPGLQHGSKPPNKMVIVGVGIAALAVGYIVLKKKSAAATTSGASPVNSPTVIYPAGGGSDSAASQYYSSLMTGIQAAAQQTGKQIGDSTATTAGNITSGTQTVTGAISAAQQQLDQAIHNNPPSNPAPTPSPPTPAAVTPPHPFYTAPGPGGQTLDVIAYVDKNAPAGQITGYNVGGGAPVYADVPGASTWQLGLPASALVPGTTLATPAQYWNNVIPGIGTEQLR